MQRATGEMDICVINIIYQKPWRAKMGNTRGHLSAFVI